MNVSRSIMWASCLAALLLLGGPVVLAQDPAQDEGDPPILRATYYAAQKRVEEAKAQEEKKEEDLAAARQALRDADRRGVSAAERRELDNKATRASVERQKARIAAIKAEDEVRALRQKAHVANIELPPTESEESFGRLGPKHPAQCNANIPTTTPLLEELKEHVRRAKAGMTGHDEHMKDLERSVFTTVEKYEGERLAVLRAWEEEQRRLAAQRAEEEEQRRLAAQRAEEERQRRLAAQRAEEERQRRLAAQRAKDQRIQKAERIQRLIEELQAHAAKGPQVARSRSSAALKAYNDKAASLIRQLRALGVEVETEWVTVPVNH